MDQQRSQGAQAFFSFMANGPRVSAEITGAQAGSHHTPCKGESSHRDNHSTRESSHGENIPQRKPSPAGSQTSFILKTTAIPSCGSAVVSFLFDVICSGSYSLQMHFTGENLTA